MNPAHTRRRFLALGAAAIATSRLAAPALAFGADPLVKEQGIAFGADWSVTMPSKVDLTTLRPQIEAVLATVDRMMSPWRPDSEISVFNAAARGEYAVSPETAFVVQSGLGLAQKTGGWFDPAVGPLVARWGFGPIQGTTGSEQNWTQLAASEATLSKTRDDLTLDLCGIAKGRALDRIANILKTAGHEDFLIDLGGELIGHGQHPEGRGWRVAVEDPRIGVVGAAGVLDLSGRAVATSGFRAQSYQIGDRTYSHIIDPRKGLPVQTETLSVSVLATDGMTADAWATALTAAGAEGPALARLHGITALFLTADATGLHPIATGGFDRYLL
ncbi:MAG TPA: FAD:protein FMN transferase [Maritimibacter sp.]|nr:FAD:protein FMN transferase [Maritimibacter sp.]